MPKHGERNCWKMLNMNGFAVGSGANGLMKGKYHPMWKLISQIAFGVHLLAKGTAKSTLEVLKILQRHVDELDGFIERSTEDFFIIQVDVRTRIQYLSLPLQNLDVFDEMLQDRNFRLAMIDYNEKIEHAVDRFSIAVQDSLKDIQKAREAISVLWHYIGQSTKQNRPLPSYLAAVYNAMLANTEGWNMALSKLRRRGVALEAALAQLGLTITEMQRRVGVASRRDVVSFIQSSKESSPHKSTKRRFFGKALPIRTTNSWVSEKPLPSDPDFRGTLEPRPVSRQIDGYRMSQKSVPNLRSPQTPETVSIEEQRSRRAKSVTGAGETRGSIALFPKIHRRLSRRFSKAVPASKTSLSEETRSVPSARPATAPSKTFRSPSPALGQLKVDHQAIKERSGETVKAPLQRQPNRAVDAKTSARRETMKNQLLQYFKSDRVVEAWENLANKENKISRSISLKKRDGPLSVFRARPTQPPEVPQSRTTFYEKDLESQMAWLQEGSEALNTYSLKPKRDVTPRIHVLSVHTTLIQESEEEHSSEIEGKEEQTNDGHSILTALPSPPPVS
ncbi:uncharacterized protein ACLA_068190 [Aspergillus clavatus NRRL 1]|uniref:Uncharacterized protein n=1 Tax=Aspergillus clavatus (strain ATCC 1007 / CBS 513.65 / DSM 816 / NCTC 3887 / NRRL 1 / QM 1276 / 107) TaxID=344612 RepID=A1C5X1_ASPCL|nr:uncharacterized protein ACLA_068190 [Aspergillus clavatus NRRL 1]EAW13792.1 conserved hypothetical protein [Aspergillus clavatus NRRL 1]